MSEKITHASTFSGIGAPEVAAEMLGWENVFHCEINPFGRSILDYYFTKSTSYEDITKTDFSEWRDKVTVLTGGFPCQPFSNAGKRRGSEDDRYLWPFMLRCIEQVRPDWFVGENVAGITTMVFPGEDVKVGEKADLFGTGDEVYERHERYVLDEICQSLEKVGYSVQPVLIPACAVGAPHRRDRVFIIAHRNASNAECERPVQCEQQGRARLEEGIPASGCDRVCDEERPSSNTACCGSGAQTESERLIAERGERLARAEERRIGCERTDGLPDVQGDNPYSASRRRLEIYGKVQPGAADRAGFFAGIAEGLLPENRWRTFPSVSPVHRGNDGLQPLLDYIAVHEEKNRVDRNNLISDAIKEGKVDADSATGKIYSPMVKGREGERTELKGEECNGFTVHAISFNGVKKQCGAHQIVWIAANGAYDSEKYAVMHANGDRNDNRLENLTLVSTSGICIPERILSEDEVQRVQELFYQGDMNILELSQDFGCTEESIFNALHRFPDLQIPFGEWKRESIKAYGNAIVVQVMFEIFNAINAIENRKKNF